MTPQPVPTAPAGRPRWLIPLIVTTLAVLLLGAIVVGVTAIVLVGRAGQPTVAASASASPSPSPIPSVSPSPTYQIVDAGTACVRAVRLMPDVVDLATSAAEGVALEKVNKTKLRLTIEGLREVQPSLPAQLRGDVDDILAPLLAMDRLLRDGGSETLQFELLKARIPGLILACGVYLPSPAG